MRRAVMSLCLAMLMALVACGDDSSGSDASSDASPTPVTGADLAGRTFVSTTVTGFDLIDGTEIRISFEKDHLSASAGCNRGGASVEVSDTSLAFGPLRLTRMACGDDATAVEAAVTSVIDGKVDYSINGDVLTVSKDAQALEYRAG